MPSPGVARGFIKTLGSFERHPRPRAGAFSRALAGRAEIGPRRGPRGGEGPVCELSPRWDGPGALRAESFSTKLPRRLPLGQALRLASPELAAGAGLVSAQRRRREHPWRGGRGARGKGSVVWGAAPQRIFKVPFNTLEDASAPPVANAHIITR